MIRRMLLTIVMSGALVLSFGQSVNAAGLTCNSVILNPITDICWSCFFPIRIGSTTVFSTGMPDSETEGSVLGVCPVPGTALVRVGTNLSYWEPYALADVVKEPYCFESMGFSLKTPNSLKLEGKDSDNDGNSPQHGIGRTMEIHWYKYPIFYLLNIVSDIACVDDTSTSLDVAYMTEIDPTWQDGDSAAVLFPEELLFNNQVAALACSVDAIKTMTGAFTAIDSLFWCIGNQGNMYPFVGKTTTNQSGISNAVTLMERFNGKLHRQGFVNETYSGNPANCVAVPAVFLPKSRYRYQMTRPTPSPDWCWPYGTTTQLWEAGRDLPAVSAGNYAFINWRKHSCMFL